MARKASGQAHTFTSLMYLAALAILSSAFCFAQQPDAQPHPRPGKAANFAQPLTGTVSFAPAVTYSSGGYIVQGVTIADVNGDGKPDVIVSNWWGPGTTPSQGAVGVLLGNGDGTFQPVVTYETDGQHDAGVAVADVNGDGIPDLVVASCAATENTCGSANGVLSVLLGNGNGTFQKPVSYSSGAPGGGSITVSDLRGNGIGDLIAANAYGEANGDGTVAVLLGNGNGTFQSPVLYDAGAQQTNNVVAADINGDGIPDLITANLCDSCSGGVISVLIGNGNGTFQPAVTFPSGSSNADQLVVADVNGDGIPDLIVSNIDYASEYGTVTVLLGKGDGTFGPPTRYSSGGWAAVDVAVADVNGDGKPDIVVANCGPVDGCGNGTIGVLLGNGNGTFQPPVDFFSGAFNATEIAVADLNGDGKPDIVAGNQCLTGTGYSCPLASVGVLLNTTTVTTCTGKCPTSTALTSSPNPSTYGQAVTFSAVVTGTGSVPPTGTVAFTWSGTTLGTATLNSSGVATITVSKFNADTFPITATYSGDANDLASTSPVLNQVVNQATSSATLTSSPNPSTAGESVTFKAEITSPTAVPKGPVTFTAGDTVLGTVELSGREAKLTTSSLAAGSNTVTVTYAGDSDIKGSSASVTQAVQ